MAKHVCKHCGAPRSGHDCTVAKRRVDKSSEEDFVIIVAAAAVLTPQGEIDRLFPADPAPPVEHVQRELDLRSVRDDENAAESPSVHHSESFEDGFGGE